MGKGHGAKAETLFRRGCNCSQAVAAAFSDVTGRSESELMKIASPFGAGFGRNREVCGAVSGGCIVLGMLYGYDDIGDTAAKSEHYALVREFMRRFSEKDGTYICRELLGGEAEIGGERSERTEEFYNSRPCLGLIRRAAEIIEEIIEERS